jgi:DNA-binding transcriptional ArsR family regulator
MLLTLGFSADDLARTRFACSPLWEVVESLRMRQDRASAVVHAPFIDASARRLEGFDMSELLLLVSPDRYIPDFLTPPPDEALPSMQTELERLRATPTERVRADVARRFAGGPVPGVAHRYLEQPARALDHLVGMVEEYWQRALEPEWPRVRALLEREVDERARQQALHGTGSLLGDLHPAITWRAGTLRLRGARRAGRIDLDGRGLTVIPNVFVWPLACTMVADPWPPAIVYPPRGVGSLWAPQDGDARAALEALLGRTRAAVVLGLRAPCSTTELARRLELTPGAVSLHLTVLHHAGLLVRERAGRRVLYRLSAIGEALLASGGERVSR